MKRGRRLLALLFVFALLPLQALAADIVSSGTCGENVTWALDSDGLLTISGAGEMKDYEWNETPFGACGTIRSIVIEPGVTSIGNKAFPDLRSLTSVTIPDSVTRIGDSAFYDCRSLTSVTIPDSVTSIGGFAFYDCSSLTSIVLPNGLTSIGDSVLNRCVSLTSVTIPDSVTSIGDSAFYMCGDLKNLMLPKGLTSIGAFAFGWCYNLESIVIPAGVTSLSGDMFQGCAHLGAVGLAEGNTAFCNVDNVLFNKEKTTLIWCPKDKTGSYAVPESVTSVDDYAFACCSKLTGIVLPDGLTSVGAFAFDLCDSLESLTFPDSVTSIGPEVFGECVSLTSVTLPAGLTSIPESAFIGCTSLTDITIPDSVVRIENSAFSGCSGLTGITIPEGVTSILNGTFAECTGLTSVTLPSSVTSIGGYAFVLCSSLESITLSNKITVIESNAFYGCEKLTDVYYHGSQAEWEATEIEYEENDPLLRAQVHYDAHNFGDWTVTKAATETEEGEETRTCAVCGATENRPIEKLKPSVPEFTDLKPNAFYTKAVAWAVENEVTSGKTKTTFAPNDKCTRGEVVTFLWRAAGKPEPKSTDTAFTDLKPKAFYYKAVLWAVENGVTSGTSDTTFEPNKTCTRGEVVTFMYRAAGKPALTSTDTTFTDLKPKAFYYKAVLWAVANGITSGKSSTTFAPNDTCTRGEIVTFLYRGKDQIKPAV